MRRHPKKKGNPNHHITPLSPDRVERILYGETLPNKHTRERLEQARGTLIMPSLQDALQTAIHKQTEQVLHSTINEWAQDEQPQPKEKATMPTNYVKTPDNKVRFAPTNNVSRETFDLVLKNPGITRAHAIDVLILKGFKKGSASSLVGQYIRCKYFSQTDDGKLYCLLKEYKSLPSTKAQMAMARGEVRLTRTPTPKPKPKVVEKSAGIAALKVDTGSSPKNLLDTLSVVQARALYDELKKIFGG